MKLTVRELRQVIHESVKERTLLEAKESVNKILAEKEGFLSNLASKVGFSNPSKDVDDPKHVKKTLDKTIEKATDTAKEFQASSIRTTREINKFHEAIVDAMDKITSLSDTLGPDLSKEYHKKMVELAREFYSLLKRESDRIESFLKTLGNDLQDKGVEKNAAYKNTTGLNKKKPGFVPKRPGDVAEPDDDFLDRVGVKKKGSADDQTAVMNYDDPDQVSDFLRGRHRVRART